MYEKVMCPSNTVGSETIVSKNTPKKVTMTKHAKGFIILNDTKVNANTEVIAKARS